MKLVLIPLLGLLILVLLGQIQPFRSWWKGMKRERYLLLFILPLWLLLSWPVDISTAGYREGDSLGATRILRVAFFVVFLLSTFAYHATVQYWRVPKQRLFQWFFLYVLICATSAIYSPQPAQSLYKSFEIFVVLVFACSLYARTSHSELDRPADLIAALAYVSVAMCVFALAGYVLFPADASIQNLSGISVLRGIVPLIHPNSLTQYGAFSASLGLMYLLGRGRRSVYGGGALLAIGFAVMFMAHSRTSFLGFILTAMLVFYIYRGAPLMLLAFPLVLIGGFVLQDEITEFLLRGQSAELALSLSGRTDMWLSAYDKFLESPVWGHGYFVGHKDIVFFNGQKLDTIDSTYVESLVNVGLVGTTALVLFTAGCLFLLVKMIRVARAQKDARPVLAGASIFIFLILFRSLTVTSIQILHTNLVMLMVSIVAGLCQMQKKPST